jgi:hypothetical protein
MAIDIESERGSTGDTFGLIENIPPSRPRKVPQENYHRKTNRCCILTAEDERKAVQVK